MTHASPHSRDYIERTIATVRNHAWSENSWTQWANIFADEIERLWSVEEQLREQFESLLSLAEHLFQMIPREVWRDTGGDDGQGHYEGDYRADQIEQRLTALGASLSASGLRDRPSSGSLDGND